MKKVCIPLFLCIIFCGCSSIPKETISFTPISEMEPFDYKTRNVNVSIDYVNETVIAEQVSILLDTKFANNSENKNGKNIVCIDFNVVQRSFIQNIEQKNTIYINVIGYDFNDNIVLRENFYLTGNQTFISSVVQYNCVNNITKKLLNYQNSVNKNYIQQNKNAESENQ